MAVLRLDLTVPLRSYVLRLDLEVDEGETVALVGPSGAGKTTVLRCIAGAVRPGAGRIALGERVLFDRAERIDLPPEDRRVGYVFQEYALFPHMTVRQNVAFGGRARADELLERFGIAHLADAKPRRLSGGERQRVGLARAIAADPEVLLFDEPLSALDAHTRGRVRAELHDLLRELRLPALLVTHDFEDATALADRVGVIVQGAIRQSGTPEELLARPADAFVASFTGANMLPGQARGDADGLTTVALETGGTVRSTDRLDGRVGVVVHPSDVTVAHGAPADSALNHVRGPITSIVRVANRSRVRVGPLTAEITTASVERLALREGQAVVASFTATGTRLVPLGHTAPQEPGGTN